MIPASLQESVRVRLIWVRGTEMTDCFSMRLSVPSDVLISVIEDEAVLLNLKSERYFGLNRTGTAMWTALTTAESVETAYESLLARFSVESKTLRRDLDDLVQQLIGHGLVDSVPLTQAQRAEQTPSDAFSETSAD